MNLQEKQKLEGDGKYISIGITEAGKSRVAIGVPWESTSNAFSMKTPNVFMSAEDIYDEEVLSLLRKHQVVGFYIDTPLPDYSFLKEFEQIKDLNIKKADNLKDISFLESLIRCRMLYIQNATLGNLDPVLRAMKTEPPKDEVLWCRPYKCVGLYNCIVEDITMLQSGKYYFHEFIVWNPVERDERDRWAFVQARYNKYYDLIPRQSSK